MTQEKNDAGILESLRASFVQYCVVNNMQPPNNRALFIYCLVGASELFFSTNITMVNLLLILIRKRCFFWCFCLFCIVLFWVAL